ncbi:hypothetical protein PHYBOEH_011761 [Phytophthora boehmeriae]|uniref:TATA element modulatory factor 1 TATA binding domain-containing protein n=1 Tax=Phytophthora boehmeriae TaxID=109152 RepID=A0A8T1VFB6_9STRA|nr:hypothetical protein PHYBOEH_011761 [Phytophthora boehmeriae]
MSWSGWGTKLNVTSIVNQGLEQVRSLREDVEKSFDQVVAGAPGSRAPLPLSVGGRTPQVEAEQKVENLAELEEKKTELGVAEASRKSLEGDGGVSGALEEAVETTRAQEEDTKEQDEIQETEGEQCPLEVDEQDGVLQDEEQDKEQTPQDKELLDGGPVDAAIGKDPEGDEAEETEAKVEEEDATTEDIEAEVADMMEVVESGEKAGEFEAKMNQEEEQKKVYGEVDQEAAEFEDLSVNELDVAALRKELVMRESQLLATSATIQELHDELDKTCHREVAAVERAQYLTEQLELMRREVTKLTQLHHETSNNQSAGVQALQVALAEKEEKLSALLDEGQALSIKQAQYEQRLRSLRKEKDELEERALKSQSQYDAAVVEVKDLSVKLKAAEDEKTRLTRENRQLTTSTDASATKVEKAEQEARVATQQLEKLQAQVEQLTLDVTRKSEKIESLKAATQSNETLNVEKAELQQMLHFLQENVRDLEQEAARREEMARTEIADLKRKWQDAVARVDMLGQSVSDATQPLLRQIHALQEDQRARQDCWKSTEESLKTQLEEAAKQQQAVEQDKLVIEQQTHDLQRKLEEVELQLTQKQKELTRSLDVVESAKAEARELRGQADALQIDLEQARHQRDAEVEAKQNLSARLESAERFSKQLEVSVTTTAELEEAREREAQLRQDLEWHQQELLRLKAMPQAQIASAPLSTGSSSSPHHYVRRSFDGDKNNGDENSLSSEASILKTTLETSMSDSLGSNDANTSVLGFSQLQQRLRLREGENRMLKQQLESLEARQKQTTDEIVRLSTRNALLESGEAEREQTQLELAKLQQHQVVLLELFGEKEEQVEELQAEVSELKAFYRKQLDTLATHNEQQQKQQADQHQH